MTSPGTYSAGTAFLDVIPSFDGVQKAIAKEVRQMEQALGTKAGEEFGKAFEDKAVKAVDKALGTTKDKAAKAGKDSGDQYAGRFAESFKQTMTKVQREFKGIKLDYKFDDDALQKKLRSLKGDIERLSKINIGANMDAGPAFREMAKVETKLRELQDNAIGLEIRHNLGTLAAQFEAFRKNVERTARFEVEADLKVDDSNLGKFANDARARILSALKNFPPIEFDGDVTPAERRIQELRQELIGIHDVVITGDFDGAGITAEIERVRKELATLANNRDINFRVRTDAAEAAKDLLGIRTLAELVDGTKVEIKADLDDGSFRARLAALRTQMTATGNSGQEGANAFRAFNGVILAGATLLPAAIPLLGALAGGLALLGPLALGAAAGLSVGVLAFGGIGDAVKALNEVENNRAKDAVANAKKMRTASESVADAQRGVERAETSGARAIASANQAVSDARDNAARVAGESARRVADAIDDQKDAEEDLGRAQREVTRAQEDVTRARLAAREAIEDLQLSIRGGALAEREALFDLADAQAAYDESANDPDATADSRARLLLDLEKQKLNLDRVRESNTDLALEQAEYNRTGIEGSRGVIDAQEAEAQARENVRAAQNRVQDAVVAVADAVAQGRQAQADASRAITEAVAAQSQAQADAAASTEAANRNLIVAQQAYTDAIFETSVQGSASMQALNEAMGALGPSGQSFALYLQSIRGEMRGLRELAQAGVLPGVQDAIDMILTRNGPGLKQFISDMSFVVGDLFRKVGELFTSPQWQGIFAVWGETAPIFMRQLGDVGLAALTFFGELFRGLAPYAVIFGDELVRLAEKSAEWMAVFVDSQTFRDIMEWLFTEGPKVWDTLVDVGGAILAIMVALQPLGALVLELIDGFAEFIKDMDPNVLGAVLTGILGFVISFQIAMGLVSASLLVLDAAIAPIAGAILIIGAVVTALVILYTQSETFRDIINAVFSAVGNVISWWWNNIVFPVFRAVGAYWSLLIDGIVWVWENVLRPAWDAIAQAATWLYENVLRPTFAFIGEAWSTLINGIKWAWDNILHPVFNVIAEIAKWLMIVLTVAVFGPILLGWELLMMSLKMLWDVTGKPLFEGIAWLAGWLWDNILKEKFRQISEGWGVMMDALAWAYDNVVKPMFDRFMVGVDLLKIAIGKAVDGIGVAWDFIKEKTRGPINWVIDTVLNNGLLKAFNTIIETLNLPGDWVVDPLQTIGAPPPASGPTQSGRGGKSVALAAGGPVPGWSPNDVADNIPAMLTADEHVMPRKRVRQYGMDFLESLRHGQIDPQAARSLMAPRGYAEGGPVYQQLFSAVKKRFPRAKMNSSVRPGDPGLHGQGLAVDLGEEGFAGGLGRTYLADMNRDLHDRAGKFIHELIYTGVGDDRPDIKAGNPLNYGAFINATHRNHVHLGVRDILGFLRAYGAGDGGGVLGAASNLLGGVWDSVTGVFDNLKGAISEPLKGLAGQFGTSKLGQIAGGVASDLPNKMWEKIKGSVGDMWEGLKSSVSGASSWAIDKITGGSVQDKVRSAAAQRGWDKGPQWDALGWIIDHESGWNPNAQNPTSTAYGLFQFLNSTWASTGIAKTSDPAMQAVAGMTYIGNRYKDPVGAKRFWEANGWYSEGGPVAPGANSKAEAPTLYDSGGWLPPGITTVLNATNRPEPVLTGQAWDELVGSKGEPGGFQGIEQLHLHQIEGDLSDAINEVNHAVRVLSNGGRYAGAGTGK